MNPEPPPPRPSSDRLITMLTGVLAVVAAVSSVGLSPFFVMATDACGPDNCDESKLTWAFIVTWGGVAVAAVVAVVGLIRAARRGTTMWIWPAVALVLVVVTFAWGFALALSVLS